MAETHNPIIGKEDISGLRLFQPRPKPEPGIALVFFKEGQPLIALSPGDRLTAGEVRWGGYKAMYKIDVTEHSFDFNCNLPCQSDAFDFIANVRVTYSVEDPALIVTRNITDARSVLEPLIIETMRNVSRDYDVQKSADAEKAINEAVKGESYEIGLELNRFVVKLSLEEEARNHIRDLRKIDRDKERVQKEGELTSQRDQLELERQKVKMAFYSPLIEKGQWQLLALQLSNNPEDVATVMQILRQQRQEDMHRQLEIFKVMVDSDAIEGFQLHETGKHVLQSLIENLGSDSVTKALGPSKEHKDLPKEKENNVKTDSTKDDEKKAVKDDNE